MAGAIKTTGAAARHATRADPPGGRDRLLGAAEFPVVERCTYLSICDSTALSRRVRGAVDEFLDHVMYWRETRAVREQRVDGARDKFARLIGAASADIAIVKNVSEGINAIADRHPLARRRQRRAVRRPRASQQRAAVGASAPARRRDARRRAGRRRHRAGRR